MLITVPVVFEDTDGLPESAGTLLLRGVVADMIADGLLVMRPVWMQLGNGDKKLMEIKLVPAHESEK